MVCKRSWRSKALRACKLLCDLGFREYILLFVVTSERDNRHTWCANALGVALALGACKRFCCSKGEKENNALVK
ncbi:MAG: hypothetical protein RSF40_06295 [Oscillospiraceae bacterium]